MTPAPWWEPQSFEVALVVALLSTACWGSWTNTAKASGDRVNFAHYYADYCAGAVIGTVALWLGPGMMKIGDEDTQLERCLLSFGAGVLFAIANLLLVTGIALAGLSIAFPVCIGTSLVLGTVLTYLVDRRGRPELIFTGLILALGGILANARAYAIKGANSQPSSENDTSQEEEANSDEVIPATTPINSPSAGSRPPPVAPPAAPVAALPKGPRGKPVFADEERPEHTCSDLSATNTGSSSEDAGKVLPAKSVRSLSPGRLLLLCVFGGLMMGSWSPLLARSVARGGGLSPYTSEVCFTAAAFVVGIAILVGQQFGCTLIPRVDAATSLKAYLQQPCQLHGWGLLGGIIWAVGSVANLVSGGPLGFALSYALGQTAPVVAVLWGLLWYHEFTGAPRMAWAWLLFMFVLFASAITLLVLGGS